MVGTIFCFNFSINDIDNMAVLSTWSADDLNEVNVYPGMIFWLDARAHRIHPTAFARSTLREGSLDHPVLVLKVVGDYVWVCVVSLCLSDC